MTLSNETLAKARIVAVVLDAVEARTHTTDTLIDVLVPKTSWSPTQIRLLVAGLLMCGRIDMRSSGELYILAESPEQTVQFHHGAWYVVVKEGVRGPFSLEKEAMNVCASLRAKRLQAVGCEK